ncbi:hypothetical protein ABK040_011506 [Willaertia magna]
MAETALLSGNDDHLENNNHANNLMNNNEPIINSIKLSSPIKSNNPHLYLHVNNNRKKSNSNASNDSNTSTTSLVLPSTNYDSEENDNQIVSSVKKIQQEEELLSKISKLSTVKQKPHNEIKDHTTVCVCSEPIISQIKEDIKVIIENDPAFDNYLELILYPGLWAVITYRISHCLYYLLYQKGHEDDWIFFFCKVLQFIAKLISIIVRSFTGVEIHPGAQIGKGFFIDHGSGVVVGETTIVGNYCTLYQGSTLGGTGKEIGKRHPTLGDNVVVGAGAKVLGNIVIGSNVKIGAGSVVVKDSPSDCTLVGVPARCIKNKNNNTNTSTNNKEEAKVEEKSQTTVLTEQVQQQKQTTNEEDNNKKEDVVKQFTQLIPPSTSSGGIFSPTTVLNTFLAKHQQSNNGTSSIYQYDDIDAQAIRVLYLREKRLEQEIASLKEILKKHGLVGSDEENDEKMNGNIINNNSTILNGVIHKEEKEQEKKKQIELTKLNDLKQNIHDEAPFVVEPSEHECFKILFESNTPEILVDGAGI